MAGIEDPFDEEEEAPTLLQSFGHMLGQTGVGPANLHVYQPKPQGLMQAGAGASLPRGIAAPVKAAPAPVVAPPPEPPGIVAYHGTPHDFDRFDIGKIGTGEGAQVYGHGLYFAESPGVAKSYQHALGDYVMSDGSPMPQPYTGREFAARSLRDSIGETGHPDYEGNLAFVGQKLAEKPDSSFYREAADALKDWQARGVQPVTAGHLYQVRINADPEHFLDWDKPLSEQPLAADALQKMGVFGSYKVPDGVQQLPNGRWAVMSRGDILGRTDGWASQSDANYAKSIIAEEATKNARKTVGDVVGSRRLSYTPQAVSETLRDAGIPGIKYLDQGSRGPAVIYDVGAPRPDFGPYSPYSNRADAEKQLQLLRSHGFHDAEIKETPQKQTRNYVVFDDKHVDITHKNGVKVVPVEDTPDFIEEHASGGVVSLSDYRGKLTPIDYDPFEEGIAA